MPDDQQPKAQDNTVPQNNTPSELAHITEEVYKKNAELAHTNKVLSLLRKIDDIVLSSVIDMQQVAQQVIDLVVKEDDFKVVSIIMKNKEDNSFYTLAVSQEISDSAIEQKLREILLGVKLPAEPKEENGLVKAIKEKKEQIIEKLPDVYASAITFDEADQLVSTFNINSSVVYPLIVRDEVIGLLVINRNDANLELNFYEKDFIDRLAGVVGIAMDNSMMYKELEESNEKLKALDKLKDEFISVTSHELRTPMTIIKNYVWRILNDPNEASVSDKNIDRLKKVYESTEREISLVNDILDVSKIESGVMSFTNEVFEVVSFCKEIADELADMFLKKQMHLVVQELTSVNVNSDKNRVRQVVINLLTNAYKFTPENGQITISFKKDERYVYITVADSGVGIKAEDIPKLFAKFGRLDNPLSPNYQTTGTGLGLYLSKKIIERLGGQISVMSDFGKGSQFTFSLPLA